MTYKEVLLQVEAARNMLVARAQGSDVSSQAYSEVRFSIISHPDVAQRLPDFVHTCRTIPEFWGFIRDKYATYKERRRFISEAFHPVLSFLEQQSICENQNPQSGTNRPDMSRNPKRVFIVYGRDTNAYDALILFLRALKLDPRDFDEIRNELAGAPFIGDIVRTGMDRAQATIVLFTPDEEAFLKPALIKEEDTPQEARRHQSRPNVLLEAGMALAIDPTRTILVTLGIVSLPSDLSGRHVIRLDNSTESRQKLIDALKGVGCDVQQSGRWHSTSVAGDFNLH